MADLRQDEGRAWLVLVAAFLGVGIITDGIGVSYNQFMSISREGLFLDFFHTKEKLTRTSVLSLMFSNITIDVHLWTQYYLQSSPMLICDMALNVIAIKKIRLSDVQDSS